MVDLLALKANIFSEPTLAAAVSSGDDGAIWQHFNNPSVSVNGEIPRQKLMVWLASTGLRVKIQDIAENKVHALRASALAISDMLRGDSSLDLRAPGMDALIEAWVTAGEITLAQADALKGLSITKISVAQRDFGSGVTFEDIAKALRGV